MKVAATLHAYKPPLSSSEQSAKMLDIEDFILERGGDPKKIKESQTRRGESTDLVDEVIALWQEARKGDCLRRSIINLLRVSPISQRSTRSTKQIQRST